MMHNTRSRIVQSHYWLLCIRATPPGRARKIRVMAISSLTSPAHKPLHIQRRADVLRPGHRPQRDSTFWSQHAADDSRRGVRSQGPAGPTFLSGAQRNSRNARPKCDCKLLAAEGGARVLHRCSDSISPDGPRPMRSIVSQRWSRV